MGSGVSVNVSFYISYLDMNMKCVNLLKEKMKERNLIYCDKLFGNKLYDFILNANYVVICLSPDTIRNQSQVIEINYALELKKKLIFVYMCRDYTISNTPCLRGLIGDSDIIEYYCEDNIEVAISNLDKILFV